MNKYISLIFFIMFSPVGASSVIQQARALPDVEKALIRANPGEYYTAIQMQLLQEFKSNFDLSQLTFSLAGELHVVAEFDAVRLLAENIGEAPDTAMVDLGSVLTAFIRGLPPQRYPVECLLMQGRLSYYERFDIRVSPEDARFVSEPEHFACWASAEVTARRALEAAEREEATRDRERLPHGCARPPEAGDMWSDPLKRW